MITTEYSVAGPADISIAIVADLLYMSTENSVNRSLKTRSL